MWRLIATTSARARGLEQGMP
ncbi:hypothetical protein STIAU_0156, partial [Stigmatella aurantiaca DW4/3-1]